MTNKLTQFLKKIFTKAPPEKLEEAAPAILYTHKATINSHDDFGIMIATITMQLGVPIQMNNIPTVTPGTSVVFNVFESDSPLHTCTIEVLS